MWYHRQKNGEWRNQTKSIVNAWILDLLVLFLVCVVYVGSGVCSFQTEHYGFQSCINYRKVLLKVNSSEKFNIMQIMEERRRMIILRSTSVLPLAQLRKKLMGLASTHACINEYFFMNTTHKYVIFKRDPHARKKQQLLHGCCASIFCKYIICINDV